MAKRKAISKAVRLAVCDKCNHRCAYCGCPLEYKDMLPACRSCNHYKSRSTLEGFRRMVGAMPDVLMRDSNTYKNAVRFGLVIPNKKPVIFYFEKIADLKNTEVIGQSKK